MEMRDHVESLYTDFPTITADKCVFMLTHDKYGWHQKCSFTACDSALWEVTLDHGHHVAGVLKFPAHMQGAVEGATVVFTDPAGGPEASVSWTTAE